MTVTNHTQGNPQSLVDILTWSLRYSSDSWYDKGERRERRRVGREGKGREEKREKRKGEGEVEGK